MPQLSRRGKHMHRSSSINLMTALTLFGLWISNTILSGHALPRPKAANNDFDVAPVITPLMEDVMLEVNTNYTLHCASIDQIVWKVPNMFPYITHSTESFNTQDLKRPYGSRLHLRDVQKENVGNYYCIKQKSLDKDIDQMEEEEFDELVSDNQAASIYIYVNDENNLLVPFELPIGYPYQYEDFTIPCKPTVPTVKVLLMTLIGDEINVSQVITTSRIETQTKAFPPGNVYSSIVYNPKIGFIISNVTNITTFFECVGQNGSLNNTQDYRVELLPQTSNPKNFFQINNSLRTIDGIDLI